MQCVSSSYGRDSYHLYDENNNMLTAVNNRAIGYYAYDSKQQRIYKLTGVNVFEQINAGEQNSLSYFDDFVLYPNPYITLTPRGATKHYYAGTERIASSLGGELPEATIIENPDADITEKVNNIFSTTYSSHLQRINTDIPEKIKHIPMRDTGIGGTSTSVENIPFPTSEIQFRTLSIITAKKTDDFVKDKIKGVLSGNTTTDKYFYHSDHLGSASWITDGTGTPVQHLQYTAWGEPLLDQRLADYNERYTFSGKERDEETGLNYFGFRYHLAKAQIWTGVDPLSDKYPSTSPYAYCGNNPVMLVDPDGRAVVFSKDGEFLGTDENGVDGANYFIINKDKFYQGMPQSVVVENLALPTNYESQLRIWAEASELPYRPDNDGIVTRTEGEMWAKKNPGALNNPTPKNTLYINTAKCDFGNLSASDFDDVLSNMSTPINLYSFSNVLYSIFNKDIEATVYALGRCDVMLNKEKGTVKVLNSASAIYDWNTGGSWVRNFVIRSYNCLYNINSEKHGFKVFYYGEKRL